MLNLSGNPFAQFVETSVYSKGEGQQKQQQHQQNKEHEYLKEDENDEISITHSNSLTENEIIAMTQNYISRLKAENSDNEKAIKKLDKYANNFNAKKFMKNNPDISLSDVKMILYNETSNLIL